MYPGVTYFEISIAALGYPITQQAAHGTGIKCGFHLLLPPSAINIVAKINGNVKIIFLPKQDILWQQGFFAVIFDKALARRSGSPTCSRDLCIPILSCVVIYQSQGLTIRNNPIHDQLPEIFRKAAKICAKTSYTHD